MSETQDFNPFTLAASPSESQATVDQATETPAQQTVQTETRVSTESSEPTTIVAEMNPDYSNQVQSDSNTQIQDDSSFEQEEFSFEWPNDVSKTIYDKLISGEISDLADIIYEQKVLSNLDNMDESDIVKLKMAYDYPDLTPDEIEEEFNSKYLVDEDFDESIMSDDEIASKRKQIEKQKKSLARELKKEVRDSKDYLAGMKQDISFPDILSQVSAQNGQNPEALVEQYLTRQEEEQNQMYQQARDQYLRSVENGLNSFDGFSVNYKDEDVQFDGKYSLTPEDKASLTNVLNEFDLEEFYGARYFKDGNYNTKQLAEDVYFLQNRDKIVNAMVTQAVSKAKMDLLKSMKNIDFNDSPRVTASAASTDDYSAMVSKMFSI